MIRSGIVLLLLAAVPSAPAVAGEAPPVAVTVAAIEVPQVGTFEEFARLLHECVPVDGRVHATLQPASWVSVEVRFRSVGDEPVSEVWAAEPQLYRVNDAASVPATDSFITPGETRRFREAAEQAVRLSSFIEFDPSVERDGRTRAQVTFYWRVGSRGTVDLSGISRQFRRDASILVDDSRGAPVVVMLAGPSREYRANFAREPGEQDRLASRGIPAELIVTDGSTRCGILGEVPAGTIRAEAADVKPALVEESRVHPAYPVEARTFRTGGTVVLDVVLDEDGAVAGVVVKQAVPGFPSFARSVVEATCQARYLPATHAGAPVPSVIEQDTRFELR